MRRSAGEKEDAVVIVPAMKTQRYPFAARPVSQPLRITIDRNFESLRIHRPQVRETRRHGDAETRGHKIIDI